MLVWLPWCAIALPNTITSSFQILHWIKQDYGYKRRNKKVFQSKANRSLNNICLYVSRVGGHIPSEPLSEASAGDGAGFLKWTTSNMSGQGWVRGVLKWTSLNRSGGPHVTCDWLMQSWVVVTWEPPLLNNQTRLKTLPSRKLGMRTVVSVWQGRWD